MAPSQGARSEVASEGRAARIPSSSSSSSASSSSSSSAGASNSTMTSLYKLRSHVARAAKLWIAGFVEACRIDRAVLLCIRSNKVSVKTGEIFVLNGCIYLGSVWLVQRFLLPLLLWLFSKQDGNFVVGGSQDGGLLRSVITWFCYGFGLIPMYIITFVVNCIWFNDIARHAFRAIAQDGVQNQKVPQVQVKNDSSSFRIVLLQIGEQVYSIFMLGVFLAEIQAISYISYVGPMFNFIGLTWLYAYYCFDYKWGFERWSLERRLLFFETNWAFFAGFGSPLVFSTFFLSPLVSAGVMNVVFPLFVLVATALNQEEVVKKCASTAPSLPNSTRLPIFQVANFILGPILKILQPRSRNTPSSIDRRKKAH